MKKKSSDKMFWSKIEMKIEIKCFVLSLEMWHVIDLREKGLIWKTYSENRSGDQEVNDAPLSAGKM